MFPEEFLAAQRLLERAGAMEKSPPTPIDVVLDYLAGRGLELHYYDPAKAPPILQETANGVDEALVPQESRSLLFVNRDRPQTRIRFSIFHGTAHFCLPGHERLNYLSRGCAINPATYRRYERQANRFAAAMNMPPQLFRADMQRLPFSMRTVESLAQRYLASVESAAIHYVSLAEVPCAIVWLQPDYDDDGFRQPDSPLKVRYQVRNHLFPFFVRPGTRIPLEDNVFWQCSEEEFLTEGNVAGSSLGLNPDADLWVDCVPQGHLGAVLALVYPEAEPPPCSIYEKW
jgi:hypothetical protein